MTMHHGMNELKGRWGPFPDHCQEGATPTHPQRMVEVQVDSLEPATGEDQFVMGRRVFADVREGQGVTRRRSNLRRGAQGPAPEA